MRGEIRFEDQHARFRVIQNGDQLDARRRTLRGITMATHQWRAIISLQKLVVVEAQEGHAVARLMPYASRLGGQALAAFAILLVSVAARG